MLGLEDEPPARGPIAHRDRVVTGQFIGWSPA